MAYFSQEKKKEMAPKIKEVLNYYGLKGRLSVYNHSTVVLNISEGKPNLLENVDTRGNKYLNINRYYLEHYTNNEILHSFLIEALTILNNGNHNRSDLQSDYHDVGWYVEIRIGAWDKPYKVLN